MDNHYNITKYLKLEGYQLLDRPDCPEICNGIGADWFPKWMRLLVTELHMSLEPGSWIHDMEYHIGGGVLDRLAADWRFLTNGITCATAFHSGRCWRRYAAIASAIWYFILLRIGGQAAFNWGEKHVQK